MLIWTVICMYECLRLHKQIQQEGFMQTVPLLTLSASLAVINATKEKSNNHYLASSLSPSQKRTKQNWNNHFLSSLAIFYFFVPSSLPSSSSSLSQQSKIEINILISQSFCCSLLPFPFLFLFVSLFFSCFLFFLSLHLLFSQSLSH